jgi:hypothetical protein
MVKSKPAKFIAIDASTTSMAFVLFNLGEIDFIGKIKFDGKNIYEKCIDASKKVSLFLQNEIFINTDSLVIEHTVFMNSPKTAADLALVQGAIIGGAGIAGVSNIGRVSPITWQNYLGNKRLTKEEQIQIRITNPGKSDSWYKNYERDFRKKRTAKLIELSYDRLIDDHDVADACGIGHWALNNWEKATGFDKE